MSDFEVRGAQDFAKLARSLKSAGRVALRKDLVKGGLRGAMPLIPNPRLGALPARPQAGGLAKRVAKAPQRVQVRTGAQTAGVRMVVGKSNSGARGADRGVVRHPVFGNREVWASQRVLPGWYSRTIERNRRKVLPALEKAMEKAANDVVRGAR